MNLITQAIQLVDVVAGIVLVTYTLGGIYFLISLFRGVK